MMAAGHKGGDSRILNAQDNARVERMMRGRAPPVPQSALTLLRAGRAKLQTGVDSLDSLLRGGFACGSLSEVCGEAGAGKTQLLLSLLVRAQLPQAQGGLGRKAVYISTEGEPPMARLQQIATEIGMLHKGALQREPRDWVFIEKAHSPEELQYVVEEKLPALMAKHQIGLVVIDSVAAPVRGDERLSNPQEGGARAQLLTKLAADLKRVAHEHACAVVVSNQVTDVINEKERGGQAGGDAARKIAALGLSWSQAVNVRVMVSKTTGESSTAGSEAGGAPRRATLLLSPCAPQGECLLRICAGGVEGVPGEAGGGGAEGLGSGDEGGAPA